MAVTVSTAGVISTWTGRELSLLQPDLAAIDVRDIARSLASQARYLGHTKAPYSVAQHSVIVSHLCAPDDALAGLLHDASEAYLGDLIGPIKTLPMMAGFRALEAIWQGAIYQAFGLPALVPASVLAVDHAIRANEARDLKAVVPTWAADMLPLSLHGLPITPWPWEEAERRFLRRFEALRAPKETTDVPR